jgi:hypothetical protein
MNQRVKTVLKYLGTFFGIIVVFNILLLLVSLIPSEKLENNVTESTLTMLNEGDRYEYNSTFNVTMDTFADAVLVNEAYSIDSNHPYESYMKARKNYKEGQTETEHTEFVGEAVYVYYIEDSDTEFLGHNYYDPIGELFNFINGYIKTSINYGRYWHGFLVIYRPLLALFNIEGIRTFQLIVFVILLGILLYLINKKFGAIPTLIYLTSLVCCGYISVSYSMQCGAIFLVTMIASIILMIRIDKIKDIYFFLFIMGMLTCFVDFLTVPLVSLAIPLSLWILYKSKEQGFEKAWLKVIIGSIVWLVGYVITWVFKWIQYDLTIEGGNMLETGFSQAFYRMGRSNPIVGYSNILKTIIGCLTKASIFTFIVGIFISLKYQPKKQNQADSHIVKAFLLIMAMPVAWYVALANHTLLHDFFVYRGGIMFMLGALLAYTYAFYEIKKKN